MERIVLTVGWPVARLTSAGWDAKRANCWGVNSSLNSNPGFETLRIPLPSTDLSAPGTLHHVSPPTRPCRGGKIVEIGLSAKRTRTSAGLPKQRFVLDF